jgi:hypothetical protein
MNAHVVNDSWLQRDYLGLSCVRIGRTHAGHSLSSRKTPQILWECRGRFRTRGGNYFCAGVRSTCSRREGWAGIGSWGALGCAREDWPSDRPRSTAGRLHRRCRIFGSRDAWFVSLLRAVRARYTARLFAVSRTPASSSNHYRMIPSCVKRRASLIRSRRSTQSSEAWSCIRHFTAFFDGFQHFSTNSMCFDKVRRFSTAFNTGEGDQAPIHR